MAVGGADEPDGDRIEPAAGTDFYYASLYFKAPLRHRIWVLEALRRELIRIPASCSDRGVAHIKLAWWREEIARAGSDAARHKLGHELQTLLRDAPALAAMLCELIDRVDASLVGTTCRDREAVISHLLGIHAGMIDALIDAVIDSGDAPSERERRALQRLAALIELAYELLDLRTHRRAATLYLGDTALAEQGLTREALRGATSSAPLRPLLDAELHDLHTGIAQTIAALPRGLRRSQRLWVTLGRIRCRALTLTREDGCRVLEHRLELTPVHKLWLAWRTARFG